MSKLKSQLAGVAGHAGGHVGPTPGGGPPPPGAACTLLEVAMFVRPARITMNPAVTNVVFNLLNTIRLILAQYLFSSPLVAGSNLVVEAYRFESTSVITC